MNESLRQQIAQLIRDAFSITPYPGDNQISGDDPFDGLSVQEAFRGKHWRDVSLELLLNHHDKLPFMSDEAYRFYLPAYLLGILFHFEELDGYSFPHQLFRTLAPPGIGTDAFLRKVNIFAPQEMEAIYQFLNIYTELFPDESWSYIPDEGAKLTEATNFWEYVRQRFR